MLRPELEAKREGRPSVVPNFGSTLGLEGGRNIHAAQACFQSNFEGISKVIGILQAAQNPIVWLGMATTVGALGFGLKAMMSGDMLVSLSAG